MTQSDIPDPVRRWGTDDKQGIDELVPAVYHELHSVAHDRLRRERYERSLNTTGLVHEVYLRLLESTAITFDDRDHFLAVASKVMRHILVDRARARNTAKRGGGVVLAGLDEESWVGDVDLDKVTELDDALSRLEMLDLRQARIIEQRYFGGLSLEEIAQTMQVSLATVKRDLRYARAWLAAELGSES